MACLERYGATNETVLVLQPGSSGVPVLESDIVDIATELGYNRTITSLDLSDCEMGLEGATAIGRTLSEANRNIIAHVKFSNCGLHFETVAPLADILARNQRIEAADFSSNSLRDGGALHVAKALEKNGALRILDLSLCKIGPGGANALGSALCVNGKLRNLSLAGNKLREAGTAALCKSLQGNTGLVMLDLSSNGINREGGMAIAELLRNNKHLESLNLGKNFLHDSIPYIASALCERNVPARLLDISCNRITAEVCRQMSQVLEGHQLSIACLSVEKNPIQDEGLVALFHALKGTGVQFLDLSQCELTSRSGVVVSDLMRACQSLNSLQLDSNAFGDEAGREIVEALGSCKSIVSLNLERTHIGRATAKALAEAILKQRRLRSLVASENPNLGVEGILPVLDAFGVCHTLEELDLSDTNLTDSEELLRGLVGVFIANPKLKAVRLEFNPIASGMPSGVMSREYAATLVDAADAQEGRQQSILPSNTQLVSTTKGAKSVGARSTLLSTSSASASVALEARSRDAVAAAEASSNHAALFRPAWATTIPMPRRVDVEEDYDEAEDGAYPPLIPAPDSLHHPFYPGYGKGRFSNGCFVQDVSYALPYNVMISRGERPRFRPTGDAASQMSCAPRRYPKLSPYSLSILENNLSQLPVSEDQLLRKFQELDVDANGYLPIAEFKALYKSFPTFGVRQSDKAVDDAFAKVCVSHPERVSYDEFCILMLQVARR